jgi:hypothetical protein
LNDLNTELKQYLSEKKMISNTNVTSFFCFVSKRSINLDGNISLAHAQGTHLRQMIKRNIIVPLFPLQRAQCDELWSAGIWQVER